MKKNLFKSITYAVFLILFATISYIFINTGASSKTKIYVAYSENSNTNYEVKLLDNDIYNDTEYSDWHYISSLVDKIKINFNYRNILSEYASGYYKYNAKLEFIIYENNEDNIIVKKEEIIKEDKVKVIDDPHFNLIKIEDALNIDYDKYKKEFDKIKEEYSIDSIGKLKIKIHFYNFLGFNIIDGDTAIENEISYEIPLNTNTIKISSNNIDNYGEITNFSNKEIINYINIFIGIIFLSLSITFLVLVIKLMINIHKKEQSYKKELKEILTRYDDKIVNVKKFINIKEYNIIYVESFKELLDVYNKYETIINYKETIKNKEAIFILTNEDNAWIYRLVNN